MDISEILSTINTPTLYEETYKRLWKQRVIYFNCDIDTSILESLVVPILLLNEEEKDIPVEKLKPITIWISSYGGCANETVYACDIIAKSRIPIHSKVLAIAASAGLYINLACQHRTASKNSIFLLHKGSLSLAGNSSEVEDTVDFYKDKIDGIITKLILDRTKLTDEDLKKIRRAETYALGEEALEKYGFIDELY
jgi:ATP-dependent protease ClpP protease subunit